MQPPLVEIVDNICCWVTILDIRTVDVGIDIASDVNDVNSLVV